MLANEPKVMDAAWSTFIAMAHLTDEVPIKSRRGVLHCGFTFLVQSESLNTTKCAVLFNKNLGLPIISSSFTYYCGVFLFAVAVQWDVNVARFDLVSEQSQAAFAFVDLMQHNDHHCDHSAGPPMPRAHAGHAASPGAERTDDTKVIIDAPEGTESAIPPKYALNKANVHAMRKLAGASH